MLKFEISYKDLYKKLKKDIEKNIYQVGILNDKFEKKPLNKKFGFSKVEGFQVRKNYGNLNIKISEVAGNLQNKYKWLDLPFLKRFKDICKCLCDNIFNKENINKKLANIFKIGIKNKEFGKNKTSTIKNKGFDHLMVDTGTFYKNIISKKGK